MSHIKSTISLALLMTLTAIGAERLVATGHLSSPIKWEETIANHNTASLEEMCAWNQWPAIWRQMGRTDEPPTMTECIKPLRKCSQYHPTLCSNDHMAVMLLDLEIALKQHKD